jgi:hypothetical protein
METLIKAVEQAIASEQNSIKYNEEKITQHQKWVDDAKAKKAKLEEELQQLKEKLS